MVNYIFKVSLSNDVFRKIVISSKYTLEDFHFAILNTYEFLEDTHLYSFYMDGKKYSNNYYNSSMGEEGPFTDEAIIGKLDLYIGQKILYLFDYGECWEFSVVLNDIKSDKIKLSNPLVVESVGVAPIQYVNDDYYYYYY